MYFIYLYIYICVCVYIYIYIYIHTTHIHIYMYSFTRQRTDELSFEFMQFLQVTLHLLNLNNQYLRPQLVYNIYEETSEAEILIYRDYIQN